MLRAIGRGLLGRAEVRELTSGSETANLLYLALPAVSTNFLQAAFNLVDIFWVGRLGAEALAAVSEVIALSKGEFVEEVALTAARTLWGACVAETRITAATAADDEGTVTLWGRDATVRNLRIGGPRPGVWVQGRARAVHLEDIAIERPLIAGILVASEARVTGRNVVVREARCRWRMLRPGPTAVQGLVRRVADRRPTSCSLPGRPRPR